MIIATQRAAANTREEVQCIDEASLEELAQKSAHREGGGGAKASGSYCGGEKLKKKKRRQRVGWKRQIMNTMASWRTPTEWMIVTITALFNLNCSAEHPALRLERQTKADPLLVAEQLMC